MVAWDDPSVTRSVLYRGATSVAPNPALKISGLQPPHVLHRLRRRSQNFLLRPMLLPTAPFASHPQAPAPAHAPPAPGAPPAACAGPVAMPACARPVYPQTQSAQPPARLAVFLSAPAPPPLQGSGSVWFAAWP